MLCISIHAPAKGATVQSLNISLLLRFQSTLPRRERRSCASISENDIANFNPRSREGSDFRTLFRLLAYVIFQSTLPRRERRKSGSQCCYGTEISIHAPAKGATTWEYRTTQKLRISIHAPAKGATYTNAYYNCRRWYFNPRSREGSDKVMDSESFKISHFNPRSREGSDFSGRFILYFFYIFQSTLPRRERHLSTISCNVSTDISIHAPAKGATLLDARSFQILNNFNPRSREGSDSIFHCVRQFIRIISIHAPAKGATFNVYKGTAAKEFQSTLPRRERRDLLVGMQTQVISIHAPAKGATGDH